MKKTILFVVVLMLSMMVQAQTHLFTDSHTIKKWNDKYEEFGSPREVISAEVFTVYKNTLIHKHDGETTLYYIITSEIKEDDSIEAILKSETGEECFMIISIPHNRIFLTKNKYSILYVYRISNIMD